MRTAQLVEPHVHGVGELCEPVVVLGLLPGRKRCGGQRGPEICAQCVGRGRQLCLHGLTGFDAFADATRQFRLRGGDGFDVGGDQCQLCLAFCL